jgi:hypothetical protein
MKKLIIPLLFSLLSSCGPGGREIECNSVGLADLDATWRAHISRDTLVTWPDSGKTEKRESEFTALIEADQCGSHLNFFSMVGKVDDHGAHLFRDITSVDFWGLKYTSVGEGYTDTEYAWIKVNTDYGFATYDTTITVTLLERQFD